MGIYLATDFTDESDNPFQIQRNPWPKVVPEVGLEPT